MNVLSGAWTNWTYVYFDIWYSAWPRYFDWLHVAAWFFQTMGDAGQPHPRHHKNIYFVSMTHPSNSGAQTEDNMEYYHWQTVTIPRDIEADTSAVHTSHFINIFCKGECFGKWGFLFLVPNLRLPFDSLTTWTFLLPLFLQQNALQEMKIDFKNIKFVVKWLNK